MSNTNTDTVKITLTKCKPGHYLANYNNREDILANGDTVHEALENLNYLYNAVLEHESKQQPVEDKRIEVLFFDQKQYMVGVKPKEIGYELSCNKAIPPEKYEAVKQAIEKTINGENDNPAPPTLERQDMPLRSTDMQAEKPFENKVGQESKEDKGWEILSYSMKNRIGKNSFFTKYRDGVFVSSFMLGTEFIEDKICKVSDIHSVRRKSDGEVFELNKVYYDEMGRALKPVKKFFEKEGVMYAQFNEGYGSNDGCLGINSLQKQPKEEPKPLFVTEDGVGVYKNGECWIYEEDYPNPYQWINCCEEGINEGFKYFSTKAAAEEYILMNKCCLSVNEVLNICMKMVGNENFSKMLIDKKELTELANNKINKQ